MSQWIKTDDGWTKTAGNAKASGGGGGASSWAELSGKPFESIGQNLSVDDQGRLNASGGSSSSNLRELNDVQINDELWDSQILQYDIAWEKWINRTLYSSGISHVTRISQTEVRVEPLNSVIDELRDAVGQANDLLEGV